MTAASMYQAWMGVKMKSWRKVRCWEVHQCRLWPIRICGVILHYLMLPIKSYNYIPLHHGPVRPYPKYFYWFLYFSCLENGCLANSDASTRLNIVTQISFHRQSPFPKLTIFNVFSWIASSTNTLIHPNTFVVRSLFHGFSTQWVPTRHHDHLVQWWVATHVEALVQHGATYAGLPDRKTTRSIGQSRNWLGLSIVMGVPRNEWFYSGKSH